MEHMSGVPAHTIKCETYPSFLQVDKWYLTVTNMRTQRLTIVYSTIHVFLFMLPVTNIYSETKASIFVSLHSDKVSKQNKT
jgi:hypothetical protein